MSVSVVEWAKMTQVTLCFMSVAATQVAVKMMVIEPGRGTRDQHYQHH